MASRPRTPQKFQLMRTSTVFAVLCFILAFHTCGFGQTYTINTVAGGALPENMAGLSAMLGTVYGITADAAGNVYIALADYSVVLRLDTDGRLTRVAGNGTTGFSGDGGPATSGQLSSPRGLAVDASGDLYIADAGNNRIRKVSGGAISTVAGGGTSLGDEGPATSAQLKGPLDVAVDGSGNIYIADTGNHRIRLVMDGSIMTIAGTGTAGYTGDGGASPDAQLSSPTGVALGPTGKLYIADYGNKCIRSIDAGHTIITETRGLSSPRGVAVNQAGTVYIADAGRNIVSQLSNGVVSTAAGSGSPGYNGDYMPPTSAQLTSPSDVAVDGAGRLYIADTGSGRIRQVAPRPAEEPGSGPLQITSVAGGGRPLGSNGPATGAQLLNPNDVTVDDAGNLYIADMNNNLVRKVSDGSIVTVAGDGSGFFRGDGGAATNAGLNLPVSVAVDGAGNLYISDYNDGHLRMVSNGVITTVAGGGSNRSGDVAATSVWLDHPSGISVDSAGNLYIADTNNNVIRKVSNGLSVTIAGSLGRGYKGDDGAATSATLNQPVGVAADDAGNVYIADYGNNRIRKVAGGVITTVAGNGKAAYAGDGGPAIDAQVNGPSDVAVDRAGNVYIADYGNNTIRRIAGGVITTIAGNGTAGFSGDGGAATGAQLNLPAGVFVDKAGNVFVADYNNQVIRALTPSGPPCTFSVAPSSLSVSISGGSVVANISTGDNCSWAIWGLPTWLTLTGGNVRTGPGSATLVVAGTNQGSRSAIVSIAGAAVGVAQDGPACAFAVSPSSLSFAGSGGSLSLKIDTDGACPWSISGLPAWVSVSGGTNGVGPASVALVAASNVGGSRNATISVAGISVQVSQGALVCKYALSPGGQSFPAAGGTGTFTVNTSPGCAWSVSAGSSSASLIGSTTGNGSGQVTYSVPAFKTYSLSYINVTAPGWGSLSFEVAQLSDKTMTSPIGTMAQLASAGTWKTAITLINANAGPREVRLTFADNNGAPLTLPVTRMQPTVSPPAPPTGGPLLAAALQPLVNGNGSMVIETEGPDDQPTQVGWGQVVAASNFNLSGFAIFRQNSANGPQEAVVPFETRNAGSYFLWFDNTGSFSTGVAVANAVAQAGGVTVVIRDEGGKTIDQGSIPLVAQGHDSFALADRFPSTAQRRGTVEFQTPSGGQISVLGLRFNAGSFTSIPVLVSAGASTGASLSAAGSMAHLASAGTWKTTITLVNTGSSPAQARLNFFSNSGQALPLPLTFPSTPTDAAVTVSTLDRSLAPGASVAIETTGPDSQPFQVGWVQLLTNNPNVGGFAIFRSKVDGGEQEAVVPLETRNPNSFIQWFDNTSGFVTGVALASGSSKAADVSVTARDETGKTIGQSTVALAALGHDSFVLADRLPFTAGQRGTLEFARPSGGQISVLGLRFNGSAFTTIPVMTK